MRIVTFHNPGAQLPLIMQLAREQGANPQQVATPDAHRPILAGIGQTQQDDADVSFDWSTLPATLLQLLQAPNIISAQNSLRDINVQRAQKGLPPLSDNYLRAIQPGVNVTLDDSTRNAIIVGALVIGGLLFAARR